jgi:RNA recognition motif-containing protein
MGKRIYCGNLSYQATEDDVRGLFQEHGTVESVHLVIDRATNMSRGFAFVEMADDSAASKAIEALDGFGFQNRNLKVNEARPREERSGGGGYGGGGGGYGGGGRREGGFGGGRRDGGGGYGGGGGGGYGGGGGRERRGGGRGDRW